MISIFLRRMANISDFLGCLVGMSLSLFILCPVCLVLWIPVYLISGQNTMKLWSFVFGACADRADAIEW